MNNGLILNYPSGHLAFDSALRDLFSLADRIDIAVSYIQMSGWSVFSHHTEHLDGGSIRVLTTDQLFITQPTVLEQALKRGITTKCFQRGRFFHPKIYIAHRNGVCIGAVVGSANLSASGLLAGIEGGFLVKEHEALEELADWFDSLFAKRFAVNVDDAFVSAYRSEWMRASAARIRARRKLSKKKRRRKRSRTELITNEVDGLDDILSSVCLPVSTLGFDHAGNNVRNLTRALRVLRRFPRSSGKERSELHLLGFAQGERLTPLGRRAARRRSERGLATEWCRWVKSQPIERLNDLNPRLASFKRAALRFWTLKESVRDEFFARLHDNNARIFVQAVELLCNGSGVVEFLDVEDFKAVAPILTSGRGLPKFIATAIKEYRSNKGSRSWASEDRLVVLKAWRGA